MPSPELETISEQLRREISDLERMQDEAEKRRRIEFSSESQAQKDLLHQVIETIAKQEIRRQRFARWLTGVAGGLLATASTWFGVARYNRVPEPNPVEKVEAVEENVKKAVDDRFTEVDSRLDRHDQVFKRLAEIQLDQQVQSSDSHDHLVLLLEKIDPSTKQVQEPQSVKDGRTRARTIKDSRSPEYDPANPLGDLLEEKP